MKGFFARLFSSEVAQLTADLEQAKRERDWYKQLFDESGNGKALKAEITRNRKREDVLTDRILTLTTGGGLPSHREVTTVEQGLLSETSQQNIQSALTEADKDALWDRAVEYTAQTSPLGEAATNEQVMETYKKMLADPANWLEN